MKQNIVVCLIAVLFTGIGGILKWGIFPIYNNVEMRSTMENDALGHSILQSSISEQSSPQESLEKIVALNMRKIDANKSVFDAGKQLNYKDTVCQLDLSRTALVLIDVWESYDGGMNKRTQGNIKSNLWPLLKLARENNLKIIHASHGGEIAKSCTPVVGEFIVDYRDYPLFDRERLDEYLTTHGITTLLYAGYHLDECMIKRRVAIVPMHDLGYEIILVRDCTIADEKKGNSIKRRILYSVGRLGIETTTLKDLQDAFKE